MAWKLLGFSPQATTLSTPEIPEASATVSTASRQSRLSDGEVTLIAT